MTAPKVSLAEQIEAVRFAETRQRSLADGKTIKELRAPQFAQRDLEALNAAARSLTVLKDDAEQIRAFLKLPAEARHAVLSGPKAIDDCWRDLSERDDRTSPAECPDMCLITRAELAAFMGIAAVGGSVR